MDKPPDSPSPFTAGRRTANVLNASYEFPESGGPFRCQPKSFTASLYASERLLLADFSRSWQATIGQKESLSAEIDLALAQALTGWQVTYFGTSRTGFKEYQPSP